jgi:hypothetical protein
MTGRPTIITPSTVQKLEHALRDGFSVDMACHVSGISRSTYYAHIDRDATFSHKMELAQDWVTQRAKQVVAQAIDSGDLKAAQWWLERKSRAEFAANPPEYLKPQSDPFQKWDKDKFYALIDRSIKNLEEV